MAFCWILSVSLLALESSAELPSRVTTSLGDLLGTTRQTSNGATYFAFEGVPYGEPPIGKHRLAEPVPVAPWSGVYNATGLANICMQEVIPVMTIGSSSAEEVVGFEDCLYLNIYTPKLPSGLPDGKLLDVIFYIHGGAYRIGWGHMNGPHYIMDRDVVFVNFNYRLGVLGFFSLEDELSPGNYGLKDQLLALKWVNQHIASFGGNPNKITIIGSSAGGASVQYFMLSPQSKGLFHKAVATSGCALNPWALSKNARAKSLVIANAVGCSGTSSEAILECVREKPAENLVRGINHLMYLGKFFPLVALAPVVEKPSPSAFLTQQPIDIIKSKAINDVPILFSHTSDEGAFLGFPVIYDEAAGQMVENEWDTVAPHLLLYDEVVDPAKLKETSQLIRKHYLGDKKILEALPEYMKIFSDRYFVNGVQEAAMLQAENQESPVYSFKFSFTNPQLPSYEDFYKIPYKAGAPHIFDIIHVLKYTFKTNAELRDSPHSAEMSDTMIDYYMNFITETPVPGWETVKSGLPNFKFLEIISSKPSENVFVTEKPSEEFWNSLNFQENLS